MKRIKEMIINLFRKITENLDIAWLVGLLLAALICVSVSRCTDHNRYRWEMLSYQEILLEKQDSIYAYRDTIEFLSGMVVASEKGSDSAIREISRLQKRIADLEAEVLRLQAALEEKNREIYELEGERD